jgi:PAS domain S-box-containing protein
MSSPVRTVPAPGAQHPGVSLWRRIPWIGALFIAATVGFAGSDIWRGYQSTVADTGRELEAHARIVAEQTARSLQTIDRVLGHIAERVRSGALAGKTQQEQHFYLRDQTVGLVQVEGLSLFDAAGNLVAASYLFPVPQPALSVADTPLFKKLVAQRDAGLAIDTVRRAALTPNLWVIPIVRRLESANGTLLGGVVAGGRVEYFQNFYRDVRLDDGTAISLLHRNGTLVARHPVAEQALGRQFPEFDAFLAALGTARGGTARGASPLDGVDRFGAVSLVPEYPLAVVVTRDATVALGAWRAQARGTVLRTLALGALAALALALLQRQFTRLDRTRESLETSRERFALAAAGSDVGIWDWDVKGDRIYVSARARELFGVPPGPDSVPRDEWFAALPIHADDAPRRRSALHEHLAGRVPVYQDEYRVRDAEGGYRWIRVRGLCVRDASGRALRMAGSVADIDATKRVEAALRESEERYALAMAGSNEGHWVWDIRNNGIYASPSLKEILGLPRELEFTSFSDYFARIPIHPDDRDRVRRSREDHVAGKTPRLDHDFRLIMPGGEVRWVHSRGQCFRDAEGRPVRLAGSTVDATQRKRAEEALRRSEERFALAVAGSDDGVWDWDYVAGVAFESARARELQGLPPGPESQPIDELVQSLRVHPEDAPRRAEGIRAHLAGETPHYECDYRVLHDDGQYRWIHVRAMCIRDAGGRAIRMAGSVSDIDALKKTAAERERLEAQLRQAQKLEAIGTLAGGIAHDFNNILAAILGYGEMAQKDAKEGSAQRRHIDAALSAANRAKSLVERILAFSRSGMAERVPVHVQSVVGEALDVVAASLPAGITLERGLDAGDAAVLGDPTQVHQVVMNLCANAVQAMKSAGTLTVTLDLLGEGGKRCAPGELCDASEVRLRVRDSGSGIAPQILDRIFDPFFTTKEVGVGTGLGLSLVHGIVTDLGGSIEVQSVVGVGSTFTVRLPWRSNIAAPAPLVDAAPPSGDGQTILLVDDEEPLVRLGEEMIAELGYEPVGFTSSQAALATFRADPRRFNAVLSDEAMPEMTGSEMVAEIRKIRPDIPIVLMSGYVTAALSARARDAGVAEVLAKPLAAREIARSLAQALRA